MLSKIPLPNSKLSGIYIKYLNWDIVKKISVKLLRYLWVHWVHRRPWEDEILWCVDWYHYVNQINMYQNKCFWGTEVPSELSKATERS